MALRYQGESPNKASPGQILMVVHDFVARSPDELNLSKGDKIELVERDDDFGDGWYLGKHLRDGRTGLFPEVYTTTAIPQATQKPTPNQSPVIKHSPQIAQKASSTTPVSSDGDAQSMESNTSQDTVNPEGSRHTIAAEYIAQSRATPSPLNTTTPSFNRTSSVPSAVLPQSATSPPIHAQRSISMTMGKYNHGEDSPVMNETLSVIDEHITDLNTPRSSLAAAEQRIFSDSGSEYSSHLDHRLSYINGHETDEEEQEAHTEKEIMRWTPEQVAEYLQEAGVERRHCEVFREQEISGEVLLGMDQASVFIPEFDLGLVGRRLRTWHKIKALQEEVKVHKRLVNKGGSLYGGDDVSSDEYERSTSRTSTNKSMLPRTLSLADRSGSKLTPGQAQHGSPRLSSQVQSQSQLQVPGQDSMISTAVSPALSSGTFKGSDSPRRPSAATVRELNHTRRHSSVDFATAAAAAASPPLDTGASLSPNLSPLITTHKKQPSFDRNWTMGSVSSSRPSRPTTAIGVNTRSLSTDRNTFDPDSSSFNETPPADLDRGYLSGGDFESKKGRNVLRKRDVVSASHSRQNSYNNEHKRKSSVGSKRHSRFGSADSIRDTLSSVTSPTSKMNIGNTLRGRFRSSSKDSPPSTNSSSKDVLSPTVTKLEYANSPKSITSPRQEVESPVSISRTNSDLLPTQISPKHRMGARTMSGLSDSTVMSEKTLVSPSSIPSPIKESPSISPSRTGSTTTSGASKSFELDNTDASSKGTSSAPTTGITPPTKAARRKPKKETSAYTRGLEKKTPQEQMIGCDYSGWMKKKSPSLMTTWKPRLFVLRGRRLSYYYTENDTEEKGLIDISSHRVLPADNEHLANIHATLTGAKSTPTSPQGATTPTMNSTEVAAISSPSKDAASGPSSHHHDSIFIFKLVPPRTGLSRAVNFTKPTVHYFAVDNIKQGRLWMAALMKATIDRDDNAPVTSTYQQKTISLAKAKAMRHRPPNLMGLDEMVEGKKVELARKEKDAQGQAEKEKETKAHDEDSGESGGGVTGGSGDGGLQIQGLGIGVDEKEGSTKNDSLHKETAKDEETALKNQEEGATSVAASPSRPEDATADTSATDEKNAEGEGRGGLSAKALEAGMGNGSAPSTPLTT
ncbi:MAG: polar growth protein [Icmadophila ericetorum]|nr:polar growth protein [Icmadophila ericetorum]